MYTEKRVILEVTQCDSGYYARVKYQLGETKLVAARTLLELGQAVGECLYDLDWQKDDRNSR